MHAGVLRDVERQRIKRERQMDFETQAQLERELRKSQDVVETTGEAPGEAPLAPPDATAASMGAGVGIEGMKAK